MANVSIWNGSATFVAGMTPFGFYDGDSDFVTDAVKVSKFCGTRLGFPLMDVELQSGSFFACFEEAVTTYGNEVFQYKIRENYLSLEGSTTGSVLNNQLVEPTLERVVGIGDSYGVEAEVGGNVTMYTGSLKVSASIQEYNMDAWATSAGITGSIEVRRVFYEAPASYDILKVQAIEFNDQIRRSAYSFKLINNNLTLFPVPTLAHNLRFEYYKVDDKRNVTPNTARDLITNVGEVPYANPVYSQFNSVGRQWVFKYTLALAKELLAYVRGKYQTIPVPGSEATLNQSDLLADARSEKDGLIENLREMLEQTSRQSQLERRASESDNLRTIQNDIPNVIYIG